MQPGILLALASAVLFGVSTPFAKFLLGSVNPWLMAGLLYVGAGLGLAIFHFMRGVLQLPVVEAPPRRADIPWLAAVILSGGVAGPLLLMFGLARTDASAASLLLNLEGLATMGIAWVVFRENVDRRLLLGALAILAGAVLLSWHGAASFQWSGVLIAGACVSWGIDNNLTRKLSSSDPVQIAMLKGLVAGAVNLTLALWLGALLPSAGVVLTVACLGFLGYGVSLVLFVLALRHLGTARTGAYFSLAPFVGVVLSVAVLGEPVSLQLLVAGGLMGLGLWQHLAERHEHDHIHEPMEHEHRHTHDAHHQHEHAAGEPSDEPHTHWHQHIRLVHRHPHYPDLHHRHGHRHASWWRSTTRYGFSPWDSAHIELNVNMKRIRILGACVALLFQPGPATAGPPFRTDDPEPVELHQWEINLFSAGTWTRDATSTAQPGIDANYGVAPGLQLHGMLQLDYGNSPGGPTGIGIGDLELGAKYRLFAPNDDDWRPQVAVYPLIEIPVGNPKFGFGSGHSQLFLPVWLQKDFGAWTAYGGGGYWINPGAGNKNHWFAGAVLLRKMTEKLTVGVELFHQTSSGQGTPDSTGYNVGGIYDISERLHILMSAGSGIQNSAATNGFSWYAGLRFSI